MRIEHAASISDYLDFESGASLLGSTLSFNANIGISLAGRGVPCEMRELLRMIAASFHSLSNGVSHFSFANH